jgi:hypothetical protein
MSKETKNGKNGGGISSEVKLTSQQLKEALIKEALENEIPIEKKERHMIQYVFTENEMKDKSKELSRACTDKQKIEAAKKSAMSSFKYQLDGKDAEIGSLSNDIQTGYCMKDVECECKMFFDRGQKEYWYEGVLYATERLTGSDHQLKLNLEKEEAEKNKDNSKQADASGVIQLEETED